jgi:NTE family protein
MGKGTKRIALVLAGAVAQGAYEAGVIRALARANVEIVRIVAASSGALNGTVLAAGVRARDPIAGAETLSMLWRDHAEWNDVFHASFRDLLKRDGLSDQKRLLGLLHEHVALRAVADPAPINLRLIVAALRGCQGQIGDRPATTFESVRDFFSDDFGSRDGLDGVFNAAVASAAFPLVFAPVEVPGVGPCVDGGAVNNTPMKWALGGEIGAAIDAIIVVATSVEQRTEPVDTSGFRSLIGHIAGMLIEERLYRDLREAAQLNDGIAGLEALVRQGQLSAEQYAHVMRALGWTGRRVVDLISIRPVAPLRGNAFAGFFDADLRAEHLETGYIRGLEVLGGLGWSHRDDRPAASRDDLGDAVGGGSVPPAAHDRAE